MSEKVIIIGAGIAGLSAGCYLRMNGYDTEIFELRTIPGGLCTSWERGDYIFDGCIGWLVGSSPANNHYYLWNELVDMKTLRFVDYQEYIRVEDKNGQFIRVRTNVDELEQELLEKAPEDKELITAFTKAIRKLMHLQLPFEKAPETYNLPDHIKKMFKFMPYLGDIKKWTRIPTLEIAKKCKNPLLEKTFRFAIVPETSVFFLIMTLAWMHKKGAGYPIGGSLKFARLIEKKYLELGGKIHYKSRVKKIITKDHAAKGVLLENGETHESDIVVSAADGYSTIFEMLEGKYTDKTILCYYENYKTYPSYLQFSLGVSRTFPGVPPRLVFPLEKPLLIDPDTSFEDLNIRVLNFDPTLAPEGKTVIIAILHNYNYKYWVDLRTNNKEKYKHEKRRIVDEIIEILDKKFGNIKSNVEVTDLSTPATVIRYTNNWKGSLGSWLLTPEMGLKPKKKMLPGLKNFYMAGQWVEPCGGLPSAIKSARNVTQVICKQDKKKFITSQ
ncbi:MAG: NAD(P)/FAD-dependent oxidoreductase [Candidatus Aminicenantes bacterium]|nr:MAG: NAD(P)/FAD-dependent oxidoreductase [Candidatus Aminicenantes bacterium]